MVWKADSINPGHIEQINYKESDIPDHNRSEILGPNREFVEVVPGSDFYTLFIDASDVVHSVDVKYINVDMAACTYNWETGDVNITYLPPRVWDDIRVSRNLMLGSSDNMFNVDTPNPLKTEWMEYRQLLRDLISREIAAGRTPDTVFWHDYVPPWPKSARIGVPDNIKPDCAWYKGKNTFPPEAIVGSPESLAVQAEFERMNNQG